MIEEGESSMKRLFTVIFFLIIATGCTEADTKQDMQYDQTKKMVIDILQTEDGKKALHDLLADEQMKQQLIMESDFIKKTITETLQSDESAVVWKQLFDDPAFVKNYAEALNEEQQALFKRLMHDATYQKQMIQLLQNPEIVEQTLNLMKSQQFREHLEETIQQTLDSPMFQARLQEMLQKEAQKESKKEEENNTEQSTSNESENEDESEDDDTEQQES